MSRNILAIGAHPDDVELGCAGTLRKHVLENDKVFIIVASLGEKSGDDKERHKEAMKSAKLIGASEIYFLNLEDTNVKHDGTTVSILDKYMNEIKPEIVYVHSTKDYHQDHEAISKSTLSASRQMKNSVVLYESPSTTIEFKPTAYNDISDVFKFKLACIEQYISQGEKEYMEGQAIIGLANSRGNVIGVEFAEAFEVARLFKW